MQSPKSRRSKAPGEKPSSDSHPYAQTGSQIKQQGGSGKPSVPSGLPLGQSGGFKGGVMASPSPVGTHSAATVPDKGSPGYASSSDAKRTGGTRSGRS